jgi:cell division protein FtsQ
MSQKRKISARKILQVLFTLVVTTCCVFAMMSASKIENEKKLNGIEVNITNDRYRFIDQQKVLNILAARHMDIRQVPLGKIDVHSMEDSIKANPWVADAQLFIDNSHVLHINVVQRVPVARLFEQNGNSYYLDTTLSAMPLSQDYIYYTTVVTNVPNLPSDSSGKALKGQIVSLVRYIEKDTFWNAQVSQIALDSTRSFELVPVLGTQKILFGDTTRMQEKFDDLFAFYKKVLNRIGWDRYETLDLRFKGQVVASPSLPYKGPVDKVMNDMNWVKSIIDSGPKEQSSDTVKTVAPATQTAAAKPVASVVPTTKNIANGKKPETKAEPHTVAVAKHDAAPAKPAAHVAAKESDHKPVAAKPQAKDKKQDVKQAAAKEKKKDEKKSQPKYIYQGQ